MAYSTSSRSSALHRICQIASELQSNSPYTDERRPRSTAALDSFDFDAAELLPGPGSLAAELEASGVDAEMAEKFSTAYTTAATRLKERCELFFRKHYQNSNAQISPNSISAAETIIMRKYHSMLRYWKQVVFETAHSSSRTSSHLSTGKPRPTFNHDSVPLLERYFDYNAYPSTADRGILAKKTGLTHRQIEVWFQNHRNRAKKTGKPRARLVGSSFPWEDVEDTSQDTKQFCKTPSEPPKSELLLPPQPVQITMRPTSGQSNILEKFDPPNNAFPTPYPNSPPGQASPSTSLYDPNEWYRRPTCKRSAHTRTSIDVLCDSFQTCLNLRRRCQTLEGESQQASKRPWYPATYTHLYPSHHPAMLRRNHRRVRTSSPPLYSFRKPVARTLSPSQQEPGFLRYRQQPSTFMESLISNKKCCNSRQLRRRTSTSSMDSSVGCLTPISSPSASIIRLQSDDLDLTYGDIWDKIPHLYSLSPMFLRSQ